MVYDLIASGMNDELWDPIFWMQLVENLFDVAIHLYWFGDMDVAKMFHNYKVSEIMQPYVGVNLS